MGDLIAGWTLTRGDKYMPPSWDSSFDSKRICWVLFPLEMTFSHTMTKVNNKWTSASLYTLLVPHSGVILFYWPTLSLLHTLTVPHHLGSIIIKMNFDRVKQQLTMTMMHLVKLLIPTPLYTLASSNATMNNEKTGSSTCLIDVSLSSLSHCTYISPENERERERESGLSCQLI